MGWLDFFCYGEKDVLNFGFTSDCKTRIVMENRGNGEYFYVEYLYCEKWKRFQHKWAGPSGKLMTSDVNFAVMKLAENFIEYQKLKSNPVLKVVKEY